MRAGADADTFFFSAHGDARLLIDKLSASLGQPVVVVNKTGGGGATGIKAVKEAPADGYTVLITPPRWH